MCVGKKWAPLPLQVRPQLEIVWFSWSAPPPSATHGGSHCFAVYSVDYPHVKEFVVKENVLTFLLGEENMNTDITNLNSLGSIMAVPWQYRMSSIYLCGNNTFIVMTP